MIPNVVKRLWFHAMFPYDGVTGSSAAKGFLELQRSKAEWSYKVPEQGMEDARAPKYPRPCGKSKSVAMHSIA